ncbi:MAG: hypothetical protein WC768_03535 [Patescibacteria group bacterium]|jgi:hypothetical protein
MTDEKWQSIIGQIKDNFKITNQQTQDLPEDAGLGTVEIVEFDGPLGKMKLQRTTQPLVIDKKTIGSRRIGSQASVEYVYSETEKVHRFNAYRFDEKDGIWIEMTMEKGEMSF